MNEGETRTRLEDAAAGLELRVSRESWSKIHKVLELLNNYRDSLNLTGRGGAAGLLAHTVEALVAVRAAELSGVRGQRWLDVGSGGGFPGLIAAALWGGGVALIEPRARRAGFLELAVASARLDAEVRRCRLEEGKCVVLDGKVAISRDFGVASARAVFSPAAWLCECRHWVRPGGVCLVHARSGDRSARSGTVRGEASHGGWKVQGIVPRETELRSRP